MLTTSAMRTAETLHAVADHCANHGVTPIGVTFGPDENPRLQFATGGVEHFVRAARSIGANIVNVHRDTGGWYHLNAFGTIGSQNAEIVYVVMKGEDEHLALYIEDTTGPVPVDTLVEIVGGRR